MSRMFGSRRWAVSGVVAPLLVALAGCGSTIQGTTATVPGDGTTAPGPGGSTGSTTGAIPGTTGALPGGTSSGGGVGSTTGVPGSTSGTAGGSTVGGSTGAPVERNAPGVTATEIKIGIMYLVNGDQAAKTAGYNVSRGNEEKNWRAVIAEVNARGGVAGRKLVPVFYAWDAQSTQTTASQEAAECAAFTQDNKVFAVVTTGTPDFTACLTRAGVLHVTTGSYVGRDRDFHRRFPTFFEQRPSQERYQSDLVSALVRQKYFGGWNTLQGEPGTAKAKVGVLVIDQPYYLRPVQQVLLPALRKAGYPVDPTLVLRVPLYVGPQDAGPAAAATKSAVLRFQQEGVTHVVILDANGTTTALFAQNSQSQLYFPRLSGTSASGFQQLYDLKALNNRQINGVVGLGWTPVLDLAPGQGDKYLSKAAPECLSVIKRRTGQTFASTTAAGVAMFACDAIFPLATMLKERRGPLTTLGAVNAIESFGQRIQAASIPYLRFAPGQHDGLETAFDMVWDGACPCIRYPDAGHRLP